MTKKHIQTILRTMDSTQIYRLYAQAYGTKPEAHKVLDFIQEYAPTARIYRAAYWLAYNRKHDYKRVEYEQQMQHDRSRYAKIHEVIDFMRRQIANPVTSYTKVPMMGHTHLYFCSPVYGHKDYNKWCALTIEGNEQLCSTLLQLSAKHFTQA